MSGVRTFEVTVRGFPPNTYSASSAGRARADAWRSFSEAFECTFRDFLRISTVRSCGVPADDGYGYIRRAYGFPFKVGDRVGFRDEPGLQGKEGVVGYPGPHTAHVHVWLDGAKHASIVHPSSVVPSPRLSDLRRAG